MTSPSVRRGVYFLANDRVYDLVVTFLNSFRTYNPDLPLCLVPFDENVERIKTLAATFQFTVHADGALLQRCDRISEWFHDRVRGHYRKLAMWDGPFEQFVYVDVDTVVLSPLRFVYDYLDEFAVVTAHSNLPGTRKWVWKDHVLPGPDLTREQINFAASTGFFASRRGVLDPARLESMAQRALARREDMELWCVEQAPLNYLLVTSGGAYTSLFRLSQERNDDSLPHECWAGDPTWRIEVDGRAWYDGKPTKVLFVHWAGEWMPVPGEAPREDFPAVRRHLPQNGLWLHYRTQRAPVPVQTARAAPVLAMLDTP